VFIEAKDDGSGGDNWSYKSCKAPVKSPPPTNQHLEIRNLINIIIIICYHTVFYRPDALPVAQPTTLKH